MQPEKIPDRVLVKLGPNPIEEKTNRKFVCSHNGHTFTALVNKNEYKAICPLHNVQGSFAW